MILDKYLAQSAPALSRRQFVTMTVGGAVGVALMPVATPGAWAQNAKDVPPGQKPTEAAGGLRQHRTRRHDDGAVQPHGHGPGHRDRAGDDLRGRTRCRLEQVRHRLRQPEAELRRPDDGHAPHRRLELGEEQLHAVPRTRRAHEGDARRRGGAAVGRAGIDARGEQRRRQRRRQERRLRRTVRSRDEGGHPREGVAEGSEGLQAHRQADGPEALARQEHRHAGLRRRRAAAGHADRGDRPPAGVRRQGRQLRRCRDAEGQGRSRRAAGTDGPWWPGHCGRGRRLLAGEDRPRRVEGAVEPGRRREGGQRAPARELARTGAHARHAGAAGPLQGRHGALAPARRRRSTPNSSSRT